LSASSNWIGIQTGVHGFDYRTPQEPVVSKSFKANIWLRSLDHLTDVGGQMGGCLQLATERVRAFYSTRNKLEMD